jgi:hypothetical protein
LENSILEPNVKIDEVIVMSYRGLAKGRTIELEEPLPFPNGQVVTVFVEAVVSGEPGTAQRILEATRFQPHLHAFDVDELEAAIENARLPVQGGIVLNEEK